MQNKVKIITHVQYVSRNELNYIPIEGNRRIQKKTAGKLINFFIVTTNVTRETKKKIA